MRPTRYILWLICWTVGAFPAQSANQAATPAAATRPAAHGLPPMPRPEHTYFLESRFLAASESATILSSFSPALRQRLEKQLDAWRALPARKRQRICDRFSQYFDLSAREKEKTLNALSDEERRDMENTLRAFEKLPPEQRRVCINSFRKFANMSRDERVQFLKNAEQWKAISPADRETWRILDAKLPPLPPPPGEPPIPAQEKNTGSRPPSVSQINPPRAGQ